MPTLNNLLHVVVQYNIYLDKPEVSILSKSAARKHNNVNFAGLDLDRSISLRQSEIQCFFVLCCVVLCCYHRDPVIYRSQSTLI